MSDEQVMDVPSEDGDHEQEPQDSELIQEAYDSLNRSIEDVLSLLGESNDSILTDWVVVAISQGFDERGRHVASPAIVIPRNNELPIYRAKGLLVDALDGLRSDQATTVIVVSSGDDDEDDD